MREIQETHGRSTGRRNMTMMNNGFDDYDNDDNEYFDAADGNALMLILYVIIYICININIFKVYVTE